jgi:hypothetical protein
MTVQASKWRRGLEVYIARHQALYEGAVWTSYEEDLPSF